LREHMHSCELDDVRKLLVYFDLGLDRSLQRFVKNPMRKKYSITTEEMIIDAYSKQELPTDGEFPNMETLIVSNEDNLGSVRDYILKEF
jgi:hypothetical protein